jgi:hypothetical protein
MMDHKRPSHSCHHTIKVLFTYWNGDDWERKVDITVYPRTGMTGNGNLTLYLEILKSKQQIDHMFHCTLPCHEAQELCF